jgi:hypothetical protein
MEREQFKNYFWNMEAQKYYEPDLNLPKAQDMINNKDNGYVGGQKWDGEWNMAIILDDGKVLMRGRNITTTGDYKDRADMVPHIVSELVKNYPEGTVLLGELCFNDPTKTSKDVGTIMRCLPAKAIERQKTTPLYFKIFDRLAWMWEDITKQSYEIRATFMQANGNSKYVAPVKFIKTDFLSAADEIWAVGGEGLVIIKKDEPYRPGERKAWTSLKLKKQLGEIKVQVIDTLAPTKEFTGDTPLDSWKYWIIESLVPFGNPFSGDWQLYKKLDHYEAIKTIGFKTIAVTKPYWHGWIGALRVEYAGKIIDVASGLTDAMREYFASEEAIQKIRKGEMFVYITGMEITKDSIRHPVFLRKE